MKQPPVCLTIAGLDPSGGAGVIADINTFSAFGCFAAAAVASITFQNTTGVFGAANQTAEIVRRQIEPVLEDYTVAAVKTGMLPSREVIEAIASLIAGMPFIVVDPVVRSTSGFDLIDDSALRALEDLLFPIASVVTPNLPEAERIAEMKIGDETGIRRAAEKIRSKGAANVLIKGGHLTSGNPKRARDFLFEGDELHVFEADFIDTKATHGTGCTLAAAIAANLALGKNLVESVKTAKDFVTEAIRTSPGLGKGHSPINHLVRAR